MGKWGIGKVKRHNAIAILFSWRPVRKAPDVKKKKILMLSWYRFKEFSFSSSDGKWEQCQMEIQLRCSGMTTGWQSYSFTAES